MPRRELSKRQYMLPVYESLPEMIRRIVREELRPLVEATEQPGKGSTGGSGSIDGGRLGRANGTGSGAR